MIETPRVAVLGAGPAGVGAAYYLQRAGAARVTVYERSDRVGGIAGSFSFAGQRVDFGSHRLHPSCDAVVLADLQRLLGGDLLKRPRHGRIRLRGRWIRFPLRPLDLLLRLDPRFGMGVARDLLLRRRSRAHPGGSGQAESFESLLRARLGPTISEQFYLPYARKLWGLDPRRIAAEQARRRVSAGSFGRMLRKVFGRLPFVPGLGYDFYYYPREGYGQISEAFAGAAREAGARIATGRTVVGLEAAPGGGWRVRTEDATARASTEGAELVLSTLPVSVLARAIEPSPPAGVLDAAARIRYRSMVLVYAHLAVDRFSAFDAHYFPEESVAITRLTEPKHYADLSEPAGSTVLCAELPCEQGDDVWNASPGELGERLARDLQSVGLPLPKPPLEIGVRRLPEAYPVYEAGFEEPLARLQEWLGQFPALVSFGRQGLFVHDNTHHALFMARCAAECLSGARFDHARWRESLEVFATHVVED
jgi:protoporphyrinogen oxidase